MIKLIGMELSDKHRLPDSFSRMAFIAASAFIVFLGIYLTKNLRPEKIVLFCSYLSAVNLAWMAWLLLLIRRKYLLLIYVAQYTHSSTVKEFEAYRAICRLLSANATCWNDSMIALVNTKYKELTFEKAKHMGPYDPYYAEYQSDIKQGLLNGADLFLAMRESGGKKTEQIPVTIAGCADYWMKEAVITALDKQRFTRISEALYKLEAQQFPPCNILLLNDEAMKELIIHLKALSPSAGSKKPALDTFSTIVRASSSTAINKAGKLAGAIIKRELLKLKYRNGVLLFIVILALALPWPAESKSDQGWLLTIHIRLAGLLITTLGIFHFWMNRKHIYPGNDTV